MKAVGKEIIEKWRKIYSFAQLIAACDPWELFAEENTFALVPKGTRNEHYFSFLTESSGQCGIAIYPSGNAYVAAQCRLHGANPKREPLFDLQDAVILLWGDREDVSKGNYELIKALGLKFRGRGAWLHFQEYRVGYVPRQVQEQDLDRLSDDLGNLWMMVRAVCEENLKTNFDNREAVVRFYSEKDDLYYTGSFPVNLPKRINYPEITMQESADLQELRAKRCRGSIALDWSYLPASYREDGENIIPRLLLAVDAKSGVIFETEMLSPADDPCASLFDMISHISWSYAKPSVIEICDAEIESYIADFCKQVGIRLVVKKQIKAIAQARRMYLGR